MSCRIKSSPRGGGILSPHRTQRREERNSRYSGLKFEVQGEERVLST